MILFLLGVEVIGLPPFSACIYDGDTGDVLIITVPVTLAPLTVLYAALPPSTKMWFMMGKVVTIASVPSLAVEGKADCEATAITL